ncbi:MAG: AEC family transporter [Pseudomonadota bacterium]
MTAVIGLAFPFFGLILLGFIAAKIWRVSEDGLAWMNIFIIYFALPALIYQLVSKTPIERLASVDFIFATLLGTYCAYAISFAAGALASKGDIPESSIQGLAGAYGNIGYMGPGLALAVLGPDAAVPIALIFCFDNTLHFTMAPLMMAIGGQSKRPPLEIVLSVLKKIFTHPFILATIAGLIAAAIDFRPPTALDKLLNYLFNAAAPCALFAMGVTMALSPVTRFPPVMGVLIFIKLVVHPLIVWVLVSWVGDFSPVWIYTAILLASLPTATNVFVIAQQYNVWTQRASSMVVLSTLASVVTVTALLYLMASGLIPPDLFPAK